RGRTGRPRSRAGARSGGSCHECRAPRLGPIPDFQAGRIRSSPRLRARLAVVFERRERNGRGLAMATLNLAGRAGRWSAAHWKLAAFGWIAFAVLAVVIGGAVGAKQLKPYAYANGDSRRAEEILDQGNFKIPARESVLVQTRTWTVKE